MALLQMICSSSSRPSARLQLQPLLFFIVGVIIGFKLSVKPHNLPPWLSDDAIEGISGAADTLQTGSLPTAFFVDISFLFVAKLVAYICARDVAAGVSVLSPTAPSVCNQCSVQARLVVLASSCAQTQIIRPPCCAHPQLRADTDYPPDDRGAKGPSRSPADCCRLCREDPACAVGVFSVDTCCKRPPSA